MDTITNGRSPMTTSAPGFTQAMYRIGDTVITTNTTGLIASLVKIPVKDGEIPAYRAQPETEANLPIILVIQEILGVHAHIQDICRRLAQLGYLAIAPELFVQQGDVSFTPMPPMPFLQTIALPIDQQRQRMAGIAFRPGLSSTDYDKVKIYGQ